MEIFPASMEISHMETPAERSVHCIMKQPLVEKQLHAAVSSRNS
jgi:hypothetical protein